MMVTVNKIKAINFLTKVILIYFKGPVRNLCHMAPNNVNTMAVGALCAQNLGFDKVEACLVADPK